MKLFKRIISCSLLFVLVVGCGFVFTACKDKNAGAKSATRVVNISLNPSIEFVLDKQNKVVTASAGNDEGNFILSLEDADFVGLNISSATNLFVTLTNNYGYISNDMSDNEKVLSIQISGSDAEKLYSKIKTGVKNHLNSISADYITLSFEILSKDYLKQLASDCRKDLSEIEINNMTNDDLVGVIKESREETKDFFNEEIKQLYYNLRAQEYIRARYEAVKSQLELLVGSYMVEFLVDDEINAFGGDSTVERINNYFDYYHDLYLNELSDYKVEFIDLYLDPESDFQLAMEKYLLAKKTLLEARLTGDTQDAELDALKDELNQSKAIIYGQDLSDDGVGGIKSNLSTEVLVGFENSLKDIAEAVEIGVKALSSIKPFGQNITVALYAKEHAKTSLQNFKTGFKTEFSSYINENYWDLLKPEVQSHE